VSLRASGADVLLTAAIPRMVAQTIRKVYEISWKPLHVVIFAAANIRVVLNPAGLQKSGGLISAGWVMQPGDPRLLTCPQQLAQCRIQPVGSNLGT
jgi:branched-chain amino acid transport system substrate-binding protein